MAMSGFICHDDYLQKTAKLTDEEVGRLFRSLMRYHATGVAEDIEGRESIAFDFIREDIDRTEEAYRAKCEKNRNNRLSAIDNRQRSSTSDNERCQKEKEKEKEKDKDNKRVKFIPPTVDQVREYCRERNNGIDPEYFVAYYAKQNWKLSNGQKMTDWKMAVITWEKKDREKKPSSGRVISAHQYSQRDYENEDQAALQRMVSMMKETG